MHSNEVGCRTAGEHICFHQRAEVNKTANNLGKIWCFRMSVTGAAGSTQLSDSFRRSQVCHSAGLCSWLVPCLAPAPAGDAACWSLPGRPGFIPVLCSLSGLGLFPSLPGVLCQLSVHEEPVTGVEFCHFCSHSLHLLGFGKDRRVSRFVQVCFNCHRHFDPCHTLGLCGWTRGMLHF